ncbi:hypothetical protein JAAARDRAFT_70562 [Jaapia argillacea MUCL 33604]|uniref:Cytochrome P450 monooxygenase pc-3 n=1 Tax=Jaapia argillacea MUCL 33604 TaxID=933084 RepID=A0A067PN53_9AGAM|nr:hypothetical protein JAAARDRAFT_70562 [Jaapia argillacea MUCL 33604]
METPPGFIFLFKNLPRLLSPPALLYLGNVAARDMFGVELPSWLVAIACIISPVLALSLSTLWDDYKNRRDASALNAIMAPFVESKSPGGFDLLSRIITNFKDGYPGDDFGDWVSQYGHTYCMKTLFETTVFTVEPEFIKNILASDFNNFEKGNPAFHRNQSVLGTGVFNSDGEMWKFHRSMTRPFFSKERISDYDIYDRHAEDAIHQLKTRLREGYPVDFQDVISRFTLDSATEFLFGKDVRSLAAGLPYPAYALAADPNLEQPNPNNPANVFAKAFAEAQDTLSIRNRYGKAWQFFEFWKDSAKDQMVAINTFIQPILSDAMERKRLAASESETKGEKQVGEGETLLSHMLNSTEDQNILKDEILNMLVAGRDTTAGTLTFAAYMLSEHPHVFKRLREEVLSNVGPSRRPTYDDVRDMKYLRAVINETLRLFPIVPLNVRQSINPTTWRSKRSDGKPFYIPAGTRCRYSVFLMHRRKDLWGPDALEFDPDRFIDERLQKYLTPNPFIFLPFNAGPRICLGQQFAYNEISFMLIRLAQNFASISLAPDAQPESSKPPLSWLNDREGRKAREKIRPKSHLTMYAYEGLWVRMEEAALGNEI